MGSFVARAILCLIFGFFAYETIKEFNKLFGLSLNPYLTIVPTVLVGVSQEFVIKRLRAGREGVPIHKPIGPKMDKLFYFIAWILMTGFLLAMLAVWAGMIYRMITGEYADYTTTMG